MIDAATVATKNAGAPAVRAPALAVRALAPAYGAQHQHNQRLAVFDLGGGTFDISVLAIETVCSRCSRLTATPRSTSIA